MDHTLPEPAQQRATAQMALVVVLYQAGAEQLALGLVRAWAPTVPAAILSTLHIAEEGGTEEAWGEVSSRLGRAGLDLSRLVLAGVGRAQDMALQLAFGQAAAGCTGVLACGNVLLPLAALAGQPLPGRPKLRLVWTADDTLFSAAALGDLLRCLRVSGLDAQGAVLPRAVRPATELGGGPAFDLPLVRLGGAYVAELVAVALGGAPRLSDSPSGARDRLPVDRTGSGLPGVGTSDSLGTILLWAALPSSTARSSS